MKKVIFFLMIFLGSFCVDAQTKVSLSTVNKHYGETVIICDQLLGENFITDIQNQTSLLMLGTTPEDRVAIVVPAESKQKMMNKNKYFYLGKQVCVTGKLTLLNGKKEIIISSESDIKLCTSGSAAPDIKPNDFMKFE